MFSVLNIFVRSLCSRSNEKIVSIDMGPCVYIVVRSMKSSRFPVYMYARICYVQKGVIESTLIHLCECYTDTTSTYGRQNRTQHSSIIYASHK